ncbi:hypothetical protein [Clostridium sp. JS66]|uniref:hypothetical protein n=1 Tax=Clostridium sp. JS66 TaxID=3064705 RepID=UPI00298EBDCC|nr:hypothetical protein [Clostridium sp. JS66]WPC39766.1 hypothetical protein Q6H37_17820 [Clostridium sp. JS66]
MRTTVRFNLVLIVDIVGKMQDAVLTMKCRRFINTFRNVKSIQKEKRGGVIIVGGGDGNIENAYTTACTILYHMNSRDVAPVVYSHNINNIPAKDDLKAMMETRRLALLFNNKA